MKYDAGAEAYDRLTGRWSALFAGQVLAAANVPCDGRVLDLATGTGDTALFAATEQRASTVFGMDISVPMLRVAKRKSSNNQPLFVGGSAQSLPFSDEAFKAIVCQFGLMFFPDQQSALSELLRVLGPGGRAVFSVWNTWDRAPFAGIVAEALSREMPQERGELLRPFSLANPQTLHELLASAGFRNITIALASREARFRNFEDYWEPVEAGGGRLGQAYLSLAPEARLRVSGIVKSALGPYSRSTEIVMPVEAYIVQGST
jgi:ubiquinone/menaquinone biosynthesis C-methylase UbiE